MSGCPFSYKITYSTRSAAMKAIKYGKRTLGNSPYRCDDHWHIGRDAHRHIPSTTRGGAARNDPADS